MGTWGTGILDSDEALDVYRPYIDNFENEISVEVIKDDLRHYLFDDDDEPMLEDNTGSWFGYAQAQLETNTVEREVVEIIKTILDEKIDFEYWEDEEMLKERIKVIEELYSALSDKLTHK